MIRPYAKSKREQRAAREGALVERALARETHSARPAPSRVSEIADDIRWYEKNAAALLERFEGEHLAIVDQAVVDHDLDLEASRRAWRKRTEPDRFTCRRADELPASQRSGRHASPGEADPLR